MNTTILNDNAKGAINTRTALQNSGMDWSVDKRNLYTEDGIILPNYFGTFRDDKDGANGFLGVVGSKYAVMQNAEAFGVLDDLILADESRSADYSTVGELSGGKQVFASVDLHSEFDVVPGDTHKNYVVATTSHDGSSSTKLMLTTVRVVCRNTLQMAIRQSKGTGDIASIKHTRASHDRLSVARSQLVNAGYTISTLKGQLQTLAMRQLSRDSVGNILDRLFPMPKGSDDSVRVENKRQMFLELFEKNDNNGFSAVKGTAYNALNAFTEYTDHYENIRQTSGKSGMTEQRIRQEKALFGSGSIAKANALEIVLEATRYAPTQSVAQPTYSTSNGSLLDTILSRRIF